jgi:hypothetical protein
MKAKRILAIGALAAVALSATTALARLDIMDHGLWSHGTTGIFGGGQVYSKYEDWSYNWSYASVKNAKGKKASDTKYQSQAAAQTKAYVNKTDYAYYNFWN